VEALQVSPILIFGAGVIVGLIAGVILGGAAVVGYVVAKLRG
jgi:hypothetical protein